VNVATSKTDEEGRAVHEECYVEKVGQVRRAFKDLFRVPTRMYPSDRSIDRALALVLRRGGVAAWFCILRRLCSSLAVPIYFMQTGLNIESFAALGSGPCQHCSYLRSHSRQPLMRPIEIPENRAG
jgi:hypothetical protein